MRDLLPPDAIARRALGRKLIETFALYGYDLVTTPPFEHAEVLERGLEAVDRRDVLRFVEPETGEVALLRPDITPQIARVVATRLADRPAPWRLCYEGTVIRRRRLRARKHRQIAQAGVECIGLAGPDADAEVIGLAAAACSAVGLDRIRIELGQVELGRAALAPVPHHARAEIVDALAAKDATTLERLLVAAEVAETDRSRILALVELYGDLDVLDRARSLFGRAAEKRALADLREVAARLGDAGLEDALGVDLGDVRGESYYTGVSFTLLAQGPGEPIGAGGRYDRLLSSFDLDVPATGFALDLDNLEWALARAGKRYGAGHGARVTLSGDRRAVARAAALLRSDAVTVAVLRDVTDSAALAYARAWGYDASLRAARSEVVASRVSDGGSRRVTSIERVAELAKWARGATPASGTERD